MPSGRRGKGNTGDKRGSERVVDMAGTEKTNADVPKGIRLESHEIVLSPLVTEKGVFFASEFNQYAFEVNAQATKDDVKRAVEELFNVKVAKVRTQKRVGKPRRWRYREGYTKSWKKAIVTLDKEHRIDFF
jgi:large subunit ribosomal protein L23